jgi:hypothetical protein
MTDDKRDQLTRIIQDCLVAYARWNGFSDKARMSNDLPAALTVGNLRKYLYPRYLSEMTALLHEIDR